MEQEKQDQLIQDLINRLILIQNTDKNNYKIIDNLSLQKWHELSAFMLDKGLMKKHENWVGYYELTPKGILLGGDLYIKEVKKNEERERQFEEKFNLDLKQVKRQAKVFWPAFTIAVIGGLLGVASFVLKVSEKPKVETKYIGVDSKGHVIEFTVKKD